MRDQIETAETLGQYVIGFSHHTLRTTRFPSTDATEWDPTPPPPTAAHYGQRHDERGHPQNQSGGETLEELYCENENVLAHVAGHEHENYIERHDCEDEKDKPSVPGDNPHFWEISSAAHIDWPQQSRMIELVKLPSEEPSEEGPMMSFVLTMLDHDGPANPGGQPPGKEEGGHAPDDVLRLAGIGREIGFNDYQHGRGARGGREDRNVILPTDRPPPPDAP